MDEGARFQLHSNFKVFSRAIQSLSRISEDVLFEAGEDGLALKTINRSKSAYGVFRFMPAFFAECDLGESQKERNVCRLSMKAALELSKGVRYNDGNFVSCAFHVDSKSDTMNWKLEFHYGIYRQLVIKLLEPPRQSFKPRTDKDSYQNVTVACPTMLSQILDQMKGNTELNMSVDENEIKFKNFEIDESGVMRNLQTTFLGATNVKVHKKMTEAHIGRDKFEKHIVKRQTDLVFSIKEFMAFVSFAEYLGTDVSLYYDLPGRPIYVCIEGHTSFNADLMLATVSNDPEEDIDGGLDMTMEVEIVDEHAPRRRKNQAGESPVVVKKRKPPVKRIVSSGTSTQENLTEGEEVNVPDAAVEPHVQEEGVEEEENHFQPTIPLEVHVSEAAVEQHVLAGEGEDEQNAESQSTIPLDEHVPEAAVEQEVEQGNMEEMSFEEPAIEPEDGMEMMEIEAPKERPAKNLILILTKEREAAEMTTRIEELNLINTQKTLNFENEVVPDSAVRISSQKSIIRRNQKLIRILIANNQHNYPTYSQTNSQFVPESYLVGETQ